MSDITRLPALILPALLLVAGCGSNGVEGYATEDATPDTGDDVSDEPACGTDYPSGPYGTSTGDTIENLTFARVGGGTYSLHHCFCDDASKLLLVYATAGWCTACQIESDALPAIYSEFNAQGLEILAAVFENTSGDPATIGDATGYADHYAFTFPTVADSDLLVTDYFDKTTAPMNMFVNLRTMEILGIETGYDAGGLRTDIETHLSSIDD